MFLRLKIKMKKIGERNIFLRTNYAPFGLIKFTIAVLGLCLFIGPVDSFEYNLHSSYLELIFGPGFFKQQLTDSSPPVTTTQDVLPSSTIAADDVCLDDECYHIANRLEKHMDPKANPCDNFYKYACGGYIDNAVLPGDANIADSLEESAYNMRQELLKSLTNNNKANDSRTFKLMRTLFNACMKTSDIENKDFKSLHLVLKQLGGWPIIEGASWNETAFDWVNVSIGISKAGYTNPLITINIDQSSMNKTRNLISISPPKFKRMSPTYLQYMTDIAIILGADKNRIKDEVRATMQFEDDLFSNRHFGGMSPDQYTTIKQLSNTFSWTDYLRRIFPASVHLNGDETVYQERSNYFSSLEGLMIGTPKRIIANYLLWRVIQDSVRFLGKEIPRFEYGHASKVPAGDSYRSTECLRVVNELMPLGSIAMYVRNPSTEGNREEILEMINHIKQQFILALNKAEWMDEESKKVSTKRVQAMEYLVSHFDVFFDDARLDEFHESLEISESDYFNSMRNITKFNNDVNLKLLREVANGTDWRFLHRFLLFSPFYNPASNAIVALAPALIESSFYKKLPKYINYGRIGYSIGHEMVHSFRKSDLNSDWSQSNFRNIHICIVRHYLKYVIEGQMINGIAYFKENMADISGVKLAYQAYNKWIENNGSEKKLPGSYFVDKTPKQLFWLNYANFWCAKTTRAFTLSTLETDSHSPHEFRVIGPLSNLPEFAKDWNCPSGSEMNPNKDKCKIF